MAIVDIRAKRVSPATGIFVARPGRNYAFYDIFVANNFVGPDLPGLDLPHFETIDQVEDLVPRVARAANIRRWHGSGRREGILATRDLSSYQGSKPSRSVSQLSRIARAYFGTMKAGDLVLLPPKSFRGRVEIGELVAAPNAVAELRVDTYPGDVLQGRLVKWLGSLEKSSLPNSTLDALQKPSALLQFPVEQRPKIFREAYGIYYSDTEYGSRFEVTAQKFRTIDEIYIQGFFNFVTVNSLKVSEGNRHLLSFVEAALTDTGSLAPDLFTNVNSPGGISLKSAREIPIVIAVMLSLAVVVGASAYAMAEDGNLAIVNSLAVSADDCVAKVSEQVITQLKLLGLEKWEKACQYARQAAAATGIESEVRVTDGN